eukprot:11978127-Alexandrium_andersonii.AAC.1
MASLFEQSVNATMIPEAAMEGSKSGLKPRRGAVRSAAERRRAARSGVVWSSAAWCGVAQGCSV